MKTIPIPVQVPDWAEWVAQDEDGAWYAFEKRPSDKDSTWYDNDGTSRFLCETYEYNPKFWRETLRKVE